jgi:hypothetical protein
VGALRNYPDKSLNEEASMCVLSVFRLVSPGCLLFFICALLRNNAYAEIWPDPLMMKPAASAEFNAEYKFPKGNDKTNYHQKSYVQVGKYASAHANSAALTVVYRL